MAERTFNVDKFWREKVAGITDQKKLQEALTLFRKKTKSRALTEKEYGALLYLQARV